MTVRGYTKICDRGIAISMHINRNLMREAVEHGLLSEEQGARLWDFFEERAGHKAAFRFTHILYYLGGLIAIGAMTLFMNLGWEQFGGGGLMAISAGYAVGGILLTGYFLNERGLTIPAGITAVFVVALTPLAVYGFQEAMGWWAEGRVYRDYHRFIDWRWIFMELATLATGAVMFWRYRLPFLIMPVAATLWYLSMDLSLYVVGTTDLTWALRKLVSLWIGLGITLLAFWVDVRSRSGRDYAFWLYIFGVTAFWGGLSFSHSTSELAKFAYFCINIGLILVGAALRRRVFAVFGALGAAGYLGYLAWEVFEDSILFPFVLTVIGLGVIWLGVLWQRNEEVLSLKLCRYLPAPLRELVERRE